MTDHAIEIAIDWPAWGERGRIPGAARRYVRRRFDRAWDALVEEFGLETTRFLAHDRLLEGL